MSKCNHPAWYLIAAFPHPQKWGKQIVVTKCLECNKERIEEKLFVTGNNIIKKGGIFNPESVKNNFSNTKKEYEELKNSYPISAPKVLIKKYKAQ